MVASIFIFSLLRDRPQILVLILSKFNPLQPGVAFLMFSGGLEKQHRAVMGKAN